jgi:methylase of polypeptide subunit release factors
VQYKLPVDEEQTEFFKLYYNDKVYNPNYSSIEPAMIATTLIENAPVNSKIKEEINVLDVGCGAGLTGLLIKYNNPKVKVHMSDISEEAVRISKLNAKRLGLDVKITQRNLLGLGQYHIIVANMPSYDAEQMESETLHGPKIAYEAGEDGMDFIKYVLRAAPNRCSVLILECQEKRQPEMLKLAEFYRFTQIFRTESAFAFLMP